jgi:hypothetical protein
VNSARRLAIAAGVFFIAADVAGGLFFAFSGGLGTGQAYVDAVPAHQAEVGLAALCIFLMGAAGTGIVVAFYPVLRARSEAAAIGAVVFRVAGEVIAFLLAGLTLSTIGVANAAAGATDATPYVLASNILVDARDQFSLVGTAAFGIAALVYCSVFFESRLLPRWLSAWGVLGAVVWLAGSAWAFASHNVDGGLAMAPLALNEIVMALWLIARGFSAPEPARMPIPAVAAA